MPWTGYPETTVTQLTYAEWVFSLRAQREVQVGYSIRVVRPRVGAESRRARGSRSAKPDGPAPSRRRPTQPGGER
jgi:hypothetical protein